jgi:glucose-1-phosphate adenylyltransferase
MGSDYFERLETIVKSDETPMGIGNDCFIENAILDKNCRIGHNVIIRGDDSLQNDETDTYCIRDGIIVVKKGAIIPDGSRIGRV